MAGWRKGVIAGALLFLLCFTGILLYYYVRFSRLIDARLSGEIFNNASLVFAAPTPIAVGEAGSPGEVASTCAAPSMPKVVRRRMWAITRWRRIRSKSPPAPFRISATRQLERTLPA